MAAPTASDLDRRITFQVKGDDLDADLNTPIEGDWEAIGTAPASVWAQVQDVLPSRGESNGDGIDTSRRPSRIRLRWREDITSAMRIILWKGDEGGAVDRVMQIVSGPAEIFGRRTWMELMAEEYSSARDVV